MTDSHNYSFFGQSTGLILESALKTEPYIFFRCLKKKEDDSWEKPSMGEGKVTKFSIEEIVMMLEVLNQKTQNWTTYHTFKENKTPISFNWKDEQGKVLWINVANYSKMLNSAQAEVFRLLLTHILKEKIEYATTSNASRARKSNNFADKSQLEIVEEVVDRSAEFFDDATTQNNKSNNSKRETKEVSGSIKAETEKALLIVFSSGKEVWIPKSTMRLNFNPQKELNQKFVIDSWILERNQLAP